MKKTKIICTMGPSTDDAALLAEMMRSGMDLARFNFSHGCHEDHARRVELVRKAAAEVEKPIALIADTKGPEMRLGIFKEGRVILKEGDSFTLTTEEIEGTQEISYVNYAGLPEELQPGNAILLSDGLLALEVTDVDVQGGKIYTKVVHGGEISSRKRVACPGVELKLPFLSEQDISDITFAAKLGMDYVAASFVQKADDVLAIRRVLEEVGSSMGIISKIENHAGVKNIEEIIAVSDGVMVARGDLGVEIPAEVVPLVQKNIIRSCNKAGKPVITATQMLESMITSYRATRAEASDIANAIFDGTDDIMLSGETASGKYPLEAVRTMAKIAEQTETALDYAQIFKNKGIGERIHSTEAISHATVQIAQELGSDAIVSITESGFTARMLAKYRPAAGVIGVSRHPQTVRAMQLYWGVCPVLGPWSDNTDELIESSLSCVKKCGLLKDGDNVIVTAGVPVGKPGTTNLIKVVAMSRKLVSGVGIGLQSITGVVCRCTKTEDFTGKLKAGDILVVDVLPDEAGKYAAAAGAIIAEEGGLTSTAAIVAVGCGVPAIVGACGAMQSLKDGTTVTVDTVSGIVYEGTSNIM